MTMLSSVTCTPAICSTASGTCRRSARVSSRAPTPYSISTSSPMVAVSLSSSTRTPPTFSVFPGQRRPARAAGRGPRRAELDDAGDVAGGVGDDLLDDGGQDLGGARHL